MSDLEHLARALDEATLEARAVAQLTRDVSLGLADAYAIQRHAVGRRVSRGERVIGLKLGFTSRAKALQMGVHDVILGQLTDRMLLEEDVPVDLGRYIHPRIEPELAFLLQRPLTADLGPAQMLGAVAAVAPALELIDSRFRDFKFNLCDVVADNCSSAGFVIGPWRAPEGELDNLGVLLEMDGRVAEVGSTAAILGNPLRALTAAARLAKTAGITPQAGWVVLGGAATGAVPLKPGAHVRAAIESLGSVSLTTNA